MSVEWFDLALRCEAVRRGHPVARLRHAPLTTAPADPLVVVLAEHTESGTVRVQLRSGDGTVTGTGEGLDGLRLLSHAGVAMRPGAPTRLVVPDAASLAALAALARRCRDVEVAQVAAHVGWWVERADFPGTTAVVNLTAAAATRWARDGAPAQDRHIGAWLTSWGITAPGLAGMRDLYDLLVAGDPLPGVEHAARDDDYSWDRATSMFLAGQDWRSPDTSARAALGLRSRCDAADLWTGWLLADPLHRLREVHTGTVVTGTGELEGRTLRLHCDRMDARLRVGAEVIGWVGDPASTDHTVPLRGTVRTAQVEDDTLVLGLDVRGRMPSGTLDGQRLTIHPEPRSAPSQIEGRRRMSRLYRTEGRSWLGTATTPTPIRRDVPLDVLIAGARDD